MYNISFLGAPGAGKGTQAAVVARRLNLEHIATGDLFRQAVERGDELGGRVKDYLERGELVPDELTIELVLGRISASAGKAGVALDGFPRNLRQARALDEVGGGAAGVLNSVVYIPVSEAELFKRLSGRRVCRNCQAPYRIEDYSAAMAGKCRRCGGELYQRPDDRPEMVKKRLSVYLTETAPLIDYYRQKGKLIEVAGEEGVAEVTERIIAALGKKG